MKHDSLKAEYVAAYWHKTGYVISVAATLSGLGISLIAGVGAYWHRWAEEQHWERIETMKGLRPRSSAD